MRQDSLYFLRSELPNEPMSKGFRWSLRVVKVSESVGGAYVAFRTRELAEFFSKEDKLISVVKHTEIDSTHYVNFSNKQVVLFEKLSEVEQCLANRAGYPYEQHLSTCAPINGLS